MNQDAVYLAACDNYDYTKIKASIDTIFQELDLDCLIKPGMKVTIKPNLLMKSKPEAAIITHPLITAAVGTRIKELGGHVTIAESSGGLYNASTLKTIYSGCGYEAMAKKFGLELNYDPGYSVMEAPHGLRCKSFNILNPLVDADLIVDIAKLKSHCLTGMSGAVKNMFGSVPGLMKPEFHCRFPEKDDFGIMLVDLCETVRPRIVIVDAIDAMEGNGPSGGKARHVGAILGGSSPYSVDLVGAKIMNMDPMEIYMMKSAINRGLCPDSYTKLELLGAPIEQFIKKDFLQPESKTNDFIQRAPAPLRPLAKKLLTPKPVIRTKDCIGCGKCKESCPQHVIAIRDRKAAILYKRCIRCFCCHEMCPVRAIDIKRFNLFNL